MREPRRGLLRRADGDGRGRASRCIASVASIPYIGTNRGTDLPLRDLTMSSPTSERPLESLPAGWTSLPCAFVRIRAIAFGAALPDR